MSFPADEQPRVIAKSLSLLKASGVFCFDVAVPPPDEFKSPYGYMEQHTPNGVLRYYVPTHQRILEMAPENYKTTYLEYTTPTHRKRRLYLISSVS